MSGNIFGRILRLATFGESHGKAIGGLLDGFPSGIRIDYDLIKSDMQRRRPGQSELTSPRNETDEVEILGGIENGISLGTPIAFTIKNKDIVPEDYNEIRKAFRPGHADFTWQEKYGISSESGGGRSSARETAARVAGGAFAKMLLNHHNIEIIGYVSQIGDIKIEDDPIKLDLSAIEESPVRCPDKKHSEMMSLLISSTKEHGDTLGGIVTCVIKNLPVGLGDPVFNKLHADLGHAVLGINAVKGFEIGSGFKSAMMLGSESNDEFIIEDDHIRTSTNNAGGVQGGISNGEDVYFRVAFKPISTLMKEQRTIDKDGNEVILKPKGRHDVCVVPRAVPIVEAMSALVIADHILMNKTVKGNRL